MSTQFSSLVLGKFKYVTLFLLFLVITMPGKAQFTDSLRINPNPFDSITAVYYSLANNDTATLRVFNIVGNITKVFFTDSVINAGAYAMNYNTSSLPNGIYLFSLKIGSTTINKKGIKTTSVGIGENILPQSINIFPNPSSKLVHINYEGSKRIILTSLEGKLINSFMTSEKTISIGEITQGIYFIKVFSETDKLLLIEKLIKTD